MCIVELHYSHPAAYCCCPGRLAEDHHTLDCWVQISDLIHSIRTVRYNKIETGIRAIQQAVTVKLNNLSATECNMIRLLFKGTLDNFHHLQKARVARMPLGHFLMLCTHTPSKPLSVQNDKVYTDGSLQSLSHSLGL